MLPLSDGITARRFPFVNVSLIVANFAVWIIYELPHLNSSIFHASFYPCTVDNSCRGPHSWGVSWITAMFLHGSWDHILGNMLFLAIFGKNVEDAFGPLRYLAFYFAGGFVATMTQTLMTLLFGTAADARVPSLGASGAIAAVLGAYFILYPDSRILTLVLWLPIRIPAWIFLGAWQLRDLRRARQRRRRRVLRPCRRLRLRRAHHNDPERRRETHAARRQGRAPGACLRAGLAVPRSTRPPQ
jgi:membrane associated rhomboid family serine protease